MHTRTQTNSHTLSHTHAHSHAHTHITCTRARTHAQQHSATRAHETLRGSRDVNLSLLQHQSSILSYIGCRCTQAQNVSLFTGNTWSWRQAGFIQDWDGSSNSCVLGIVPFTTLSAASPCVSLTFTYVATRLAYDRKETQNT